MIAKYDNSIETQPPTPQPFFEAAENQNSMLVYFSVVSTWLSNLEGAVLNGACADEGHHHRHHVHRQLELQKLRDGVVHVPAPHDRFHDAREVVVG